jgi:translation elongation factor EF-Tu-like GTPase
LTLNKLSYHPKIELKLRQLDIQERMSSDGTGLTHRSITGKTVADEQLPTHTMKWSVPQLISKEDQAKIVFDKEEEKAAACSLRNISKKEIKRRYVISKVGFIISALLASVFILNDDKVPRTARLLMLPSLSVFIGFSLSAKTGI